MYRLTPVVKNLIVINLIVYVLNIFTTPAQEFGVLFGLRAYNSPEFQPYQILTYMFIHAKINPMSNNIDFMHIFGNMFALFMFGTWLETLFGSRKFLAFYMLTGMGAGILNSGFNYYFIERQKADVEKFLAYEKPGSLEFVQYLGKHDPKTQELNLDYIDAVQEVEEGVEELTDSIQKYKKEIAQLDSTQDQEKLIKLVNYLELQRDTLKYKEEAYRTDMVNSVKKSYTYSLNARTVGASGAIFGILVAFAMIFPNLTLMLIIPPIPIQAKYLAMFYVLFELYNGLEYGGASQVAHFAHLSGALVGFLLIRYWGIKRQL